MPVFIENTRNGKAVYEVVDVDGRIIDSYPVEEGPDRAIQVCTTTAIRGRMFIPIPAELPKGYSVVLVIDGPRRYFLVAAPGVGFLEGGHPSFEAAVSAAWRDSELGPEAKDASTPPGM